MFVVDRFQTALNQLIHRAALGEEVLCELDDLVAQLEQAKVSQGFAKWRHDIARMRGSLMAQLVGLSLIDEHSSRAMANSVEARRRRFLEAAMARLAHLLAQPS